MLLSFAIQEEEESGNLNRTAEMDLSKSEDDLVQASQPQKKKRRKHLRSPPQPRQVMSPSILCDIIEEETTE
jgi:hypothetical protein